MKCDKIMKDKYGKKMYMEQKLISEVRQIFRTRTGLMPFAGNYNHDQRFARTQWMCRCQQAKEDESHIVAGCPVYDDIREKYGDLKEDNELVNYFNDILERREMVDKLSEEEDEEDSAEEGEDEDETRQGGGPTPLLPASWDHSPSPLVQLRM
jgi:Ran GTPase-activating protein (RanGAP) involved in mRNA processing and transport